MFYTCHPSFQVLMLRLVTLFLHFQRQIRFINQSQPSFGLLFILQMPHLVDLVLKLYIFQQSMTFLFKKNLNPHILLHTLSLSNNPNDNEALIQRLNLLARTRKFDAILQTTKKIGNLSFPSLADKLATAKAETQAQKQKLGADKVFSILKQTDALSKEEDPNFELIDENHVKVFQLAKILFEEGRYADSLQILIELQKQELKQQLWIKSTWARLYCQILLGNEAGRTLQSLKKKIEDIEGDQLSFCAKEKRDNSVIIKRLYAQKEEFLLLALFAAFRTGADEQLQRWVDYCTADKSYFSILQLTCPQLLRYVIVALVLNKTLQNNRDNRIFDLFKLVQVINRKIVKHSDPFTEFIALLQIQYDFQAASTKIEACRAVIREDIFLRPYEKKIIEGLHFLYFKLVCKVYETVPLSDIAAFTGLGAEEAELWILGYIRSGDIDAKIDSIAELIVNNKGKHNSYEKYVDVIPALGSFVSSLSRTIAGH